MKAWFIAFSAATAFFLWISGNGAAVANRGFLGTWCGSSMFSYTITNSPRLMVKAFGGNTYAHYSGSQFVAENWNQTGTLSSDGSKITWSDGNVWTRTTAGAEKCGIFATTPAAAPTPKPYRYLDWTADEGPRPPIKFVDGWTAVMRNGSMIYACISFKNTSSVTATRIVFDFPFSNKRREIVDTARLDRKGTFSPDVEIHGWHDAAEWSSGQGHRGKYDNCVRWRPDNEAEQLAYSRLEYYSIHIKQIEFADGTTWPGPSESPTP